MYIATSNKNPIETHQNSKRNHEKKKVNFTNFQREQFLSSNSKGASSSFKFQPMNAVVFVEWKQNFGEVPLLFGD